MATAAVAPAEPRDSSALGRLVVSLTPPVAPFGGSSWGDRRFVRVAVSRLTPGKTLKASTVLRAAGVDLVSTTPARRAQ